MNLTAFIGLIGRRWLKGQRNLNILVGDQPASGINLDIKNALKDAKKIYDNLELLDTQQKIREDNRSKAGIYMIYNKITQQFYIGSAISNRINVRFRNHKFHGSGSKITKRAVEKYGINNFKFIILEYYPGIILKENIKKEHLNLLKRESFFIELLNPSYNILNSAVPGPNGYTHSKDTREKMRINYSLDSQSPRLKSAERKILIGNLNRGKSLSLITKSGISKAAQDRESLTGISQNVLFRYIKDPSLRSRISLMNSKPVVLKDLSYVIIKEFKGIRELSRYLNCCHKTVNKALLNESNTLKSIYRVAYIHKSL